MDSSTYSAEPRIIGYTTGVFDLFHIGHVNILRNAKSMCEKLVVGVSVDELVAYKGKSAVIPFSERIEVVRSCKYVDVAIPQLRLDKLEAHDRLKYSLLFVGDDWYGDPSWESTERSLRDRGVKTVYFPYTIGTSSTTINSVLKSLRAESEST